MSLAERSSTVHAPSGLNLSLDSCMSNISVFLRNRINLCPVCYTDQRVSVGLGVSFVIQKSTKLFNTLHASITTPYSMDQKEKRAKNGILVSLRSDILIGKFLKNNSHCQQIQDAAEEKALLAECPISPLESPCSAFNSVLYAEKKKPTVLL